MFVIMKVIMILKSTSVLRVPDEGYSRNVLRALNLKSTFLYP